MKLTSLLVISDEEIPRLALERLLASEAGFEVRGETGSEDAILQASNLRPDVVVVLAEAEQQSCKRLISSVRKAAPRSGIVILGRETHQAYVGLLLAAGVLGYVLLGATPQELFSAIRAASRGRRFIDPNLSDQLFESLAEQAEAGSKALSQRERQVVEMLAYGHTQKEIASRLNISGKSIYTYRARIRKKLGLRTRAEIVRYAIEVGILNVGTEKAS
jgi:two-component system response regulator NreC